MELNDLLAQTQRRSGWETFGVGEDAFEVEIRCVARREIQEMLRRITKRVADKTPNGQPVWRDEADNTRYREFLRDTCLVGWKGLTAGAALRYCQLVPKGLTPEQLKSAFEFKPDHAEFMLSEARGKVLVEDADGSGGTHEETQSFEDFVWQRTTALSNHRENEEVREKNVSGTTPEASSGS